MWLGLGPNISFPELRRQPNLLKKPQTVFKLIANALPQPV